MHQMPRMVLRMSLTSKIWRTGRKEPEGDQMHDLSGAEASRLCTPSDWFKEEPQTAAELYGLELGIPKDLDDITYRILVRDTDGILHVFRMHVTRTIEANAIEVSPNG